MLGALVLAACADGDPSSTPTPTSATVEATRPPATSEGAPTTAAAGRRPEGFSRVVAHVTLADGSVCELCLWLADTGEERQRGLMEVTDLGGADGMAFVYETPSTSAFWMRNTVMPLSIAFFADDGAFVSAADMTPCLSGPDSACDRYPPDNAFTTAVEVPIGRLAELGIGAGSRIELLGEAESCPLA